MSITGQECFVLSEGDAGSEQKVSAGHRPVAVIIVDVKKVLYRYKNFSFSIIGILPGAAYFQVH